MHMFMSRLDSVSLHIAWDEGKRQLKRFNK